MLEGWILLHSEVRVYQYLNLCDGPSSACGSILHCSIQHGTLSRRVWLPDERRARAASFQAPRDGRSKQAGGKLVPNVQNEETQYRPRRLLKGSVLPN